MNATRTALLGALALAALAPPARAQQAGDFTWSEAVPQGAWLRVQNYKGRVEVRPATGSRVEVRARKESASGRVPEVRFEVVRDGRDVTLCAIPAGDATCDARGLRSRGRGDEWENASVVFTVLLPSGVRLQAGSGNGDVSVEGATADVTASSGNGDVRVATVGGPVRASSGNGDVEVSDARGPVNASTGNGRVRISTAEGPVSASSGNGDIEASLAGLRQPQDMEFSTGNGRIRVSLPESFQGEIDARTGSGGITSDFPVTMQGTMARGRLQGTIGRGGPRIRMSSGNGSVELRRMQ